MLNEILNICNGNNTRITGINQLPYCFYQICGSGTYHDLMNCKNLLNNYLTDEKNRG